MSLWTITAFDIKVTSFHRSISSDALRVHLERTAYVSRAWTSQERLLSRRCLCIRQEVGFSSTTRPICRAHAGRNSSERYCKRQDSTQSSVYHRRSLNNIGSRCEDSVQTKLLSTEISVHIRKRLRGQEPKATCGLDSGHKHATERAQPRSWSESGRDPHPPPWVCSDQSN